MHPRLDDWIADGKLPNAIGPQPKFFTEAVGVSGKDVDAVTTRLKMLNDYIESREAYFTDEYDKYKANVKYEPTLLSKPPYWVGLIELIISALEDIRLAIPDELGSATGEDW